MAYPRHVDIEFCHKHQVWRAFDRIKIMAYNTSDKVLESIFPNHDKISRRETVTSGSDRRDMCRLHYGASLPYERRD